jgi:uncharacterized protein (UPF0261 family)
MASTTQTNTTVLLLGTLDTKLPEYLHLYHLLTIHPLSPRLLLLDCSRLPTQSPLITHSQSVILSSASPPVSEDALSKLSRGDLIKTLISAATPLAKKLYEDGEIHAAIALGGSGGTSLAAAVFRDALPLGFPKLIVSTVASGDTSVYIGETDMTLMYSVVDIAGLNGMLRSVLSNAAGAVAGMASSYHRSITQKIADPAHKDSEKGSVAISMFGVTTPCVTFARQLLETLGYEVYVFHATGSGGRAMERLIAEGLVDGVLDITTTELADELVGGVFSAGSTRLTAAGKKGVPQVVSTGACDMVNFGAVATVPERFKGRNLFEHNPSVTLMRTTRDECQELGRLIAGRLRGSCVDGELVEVWLPLGGVSMLSARGQAFDDEEADRRLFEAVRGGLEGSGIRVVEGKGEINDKDFAEGMARRLVEMMERKGLKGAGA